MKSGAETEVIPALIGLRDVPAAGVELKDDVPDMKSRKCDRKAYESARQGRQGVEEAVEKNERWRVTSPHWSRSWEEGAGKD